MTGLLDLWIMGYDLTNVDWRDSVFAELPILEQLLLMGNTVGALPAEMFEGLNSGGKETCPARTLYRDYHTREPFCEMVSLALGHLTGMVSVPTGLLDPLPAIRALQFGNMAGVTTLPKGFLDRLPVLGNARFVGMDLAAIEADLFEANPELFSLVLDGLLATNDLPLPGGLLAPPDSLLYLSLRSNRLTTIAEALPNETTTITSLNLASNMLESLPSGFLGSVTPKLNELNLRNNNFTQLPDGFFAGLTQPIRRLDLSGNPGPDGDPETPDFMLSAELVTRTDSEAKSDSVWISIAAGTPVDLTFDLFVSTGYVGTPAQEATHQSVVSVPLKVPAGGVMSQKVVVSRLDTIPFAGTCLGPEAQDDPCYFEPSDVPNGRAEIFVRSKGGALNVSGLKLDADFRPMVLFSYPSDEASMPYLKKPLPVIRVLKGGRYLNTAQHPEDEAISNPNSYGTVRMNLADFFGRTATVADDPGFDFVAISVDPFEEHTTAGSLTNPIFALSDEPGVSSRTVIDTTYTVDYSEDPPAITRTFTTIGERWFDNCASHRRHYADRESVPTPYSRVCGELVIVPDNWEAGTYDVQVDALELSTFEILSMTLRVEVLEKDDTKFNIDWVDANGAIASNPKMRTALDHAVAEWGRVLGDVADVRVNLETDFPARFGCQTVRRPPIYVTGVDDMLVWVDAFYDDGPGGTLAAASTCFTRDATDALEGQRELGFGIPVVGWFYFDLADVDRLSQAKLNATVLHELGHTLGIGMPSKLAGSWFQQAECRDANRTRGGCFSSSHYDPYVPGANAIAAFDAANGRDVNGDQTYHGNRVPIEPGRRLGSSGGHWRESVLAWELMTPYLTQRADGEIPFSAITAGFLRDMGYPLLGTPSLTWPAQYCIPDLTSHYGAALPCGDTAAGDGADLSLEEQIRRGLAIDLSHDVVVGPVGVLDINGEIEMFYPRVPVTFEAARRLQQLDRDDDPDDNR